MNRIPIQFVNLPTWLIFAYGWGVVGFLCAAGSFLAKDIPAGMLCFYFFISWILWIGCLFLDLKKHGFVLLMSLWLLIDLSILLTFISVVNSLGDVANSQGAEMVWGITYLPSILPFGLIVNAFDYSSAWGFVRTFCVDHFGPAYGHMLETWIPLSLISLMQGCILLLITWLCRLAGRHLSAS